MSSIEECRVKECQSLAPRQGKTMPEPWSWKASGNSCGSLLCEKIVVTINQWTNL
jgi:hypothetical protein